MSLPLISGAAEPPDWLWSGDEPRIASVFQPIVDLMTGEPIGYEVLSRGVGSIQAPHVLFSKARVEGVTWELERACWTAAVRRIALLPIEARRVPFFLNVGPDVLSDPRFGDGSTLELLARHGMSPRQIVLEITETSTFADSEQLQRLTRQYMGHGFGIALDDFGAGHSGLVTLVNCAPHFIKLDQALVRDIHRHSYRQHLVKSLVDFASRVDCTLIAEGIETWDELNVLLRLGIRHAQGFLLARPAPEPPRPYQEFELCRLEALRTLHCQKDAVDETELEVRAATGADPLTHLPGNRMIERWIRQALQGSGFTVIYGDLDHFKEYNDRYGFLQGDKLLRLTARVLSESLHLLPRGSQLGHVSGDDFVLVCPDAVESSTLEAICQRFDEEKRALFDASDLERGWFEAMDRKGARVEVPPVTLSLAVLDSRKMGGSVHPASLSGMAASLKKKVKELAASARASSFMFERRAQQ
jgi:diguanylate cyclase (GGDEF)-like protein